LEPVPAIHFGTVGPYRTADEEVDPQHLRRGGRLAGGGIQPSEPALDHTHRTPPVCTSSPLTIRTGCAHSGRV
jgi:hypothetical protein